MDVADAVTLEDIERQMDEALIQRGQQIIAELRDRGLYRLARVRRIR